MYAPAAAVRSAFQTPNVQSRQRYVFFVNTSGFHFLSIVVVGKRRYIMLLCIIKGTFKRMLFSKNGSIVTVSGLKVTSHNSRGSILYVRSRGGCWKCLLVPERSYSATLRYYVNTSFHACSSVLH
jgi:hypothetical protein